MAETDPGSISFPLEHLEVGTKTHTGRVRSDMQDFLRKYYKIPLTNQYQHKGALFLVADGMGGHPRGKDSARFVAEFSLQYFTRAFEPDIAVSTMANPGQFPLPERFESLLQEANRRLVEKYSRNGGTTIAAALVKKYPDAEHHDLYAFHAGDSRVYVVRPGETITNLFPDDRDGEGNLTNYLGMGSLLQVHQAHQKLEEGDFLLLCTDGLCQHVSDEEIEERLLNASSPKNAADILTALALRRGGKDNIAVLIAEITEN